MPTINVVATADDGYYEGAAFDTAGSWWDSAGTGFFIMRNVMIPRGAVITSADIDYYVKQVFNQPRMRLQGIYLGDAPAIDGAYLAGSYPKTTAQVVHDYAAAGVGNSGGGWAQINAYASALAVGAFSVTAILQEIVNHPDWVSGNDIAFVVTDNDSGLYLLAQINDLTDSASYPIKLNYTVSDAPTVTGCTTLRAGGTATVTGISLAGTTGVTVSHAAGVSQSQTLLTAGYDEVTFTVVEGQLPPFGPVTLTLTGGTAPAVFAAQMGPAGANMAGVILANPYSDESSVGHGATPALATGQILEYNHADEWIIGANAVPYSVPNPTNNVLSIRRWLPTLPGYDTGGTGAGGQYFTITVADSGAGNLAPTFTNADEVTVGRGQTGSLLLTGFDLDGGTLTFSVVDNDYSSWVAFAGGNTLNLSPPAGLPVGDYPVTVRVSDGADSTDMTVTIHVADVVKPVISLVGGASPVVINVGGTYSEPGYSATDDVDGNITANVVVTGAVNPAVAGVYSLYYNVSDSAGNAADQAVRTVRVNAAPAFTSAASVTVNDWGTATHTLTSTDEGAVTYSIVGTPPAGVSLSGAVLTFAGQTVGSYSLTVRATDQQGLFTNQSIAVTVDGRPVFYNGTSLSVAAGDFVPLVIEAKDPEGNAVALTGITIPAGLVFTPISQPQTTSNGTVYTGNITGVLAAGTHPVVIRAIAANGSGTTDFTLTIVASASGNHAPTFTSGDSIVAQQGQTVQHTLVANDVDGNSLTYSMTSAYPWITRSGTAITVAPTTAVPTGAYQIVATASDGMLTATQTITVFVNEAGQVNTPPDIISPTTVSLVSGQTVSQQVQVNDDGEVTFSLRGAVPAGVAIDGDGMLTVSISAAGTYQITVRATDAYGLYDDQVVTITVAAPGAVPAVTPKERTIVVNRDGSVTYQPFFQDPSATLDYRVDLTKWLAGTDTVQTMAFSESSDMQIVSQEGDALGGRVMLTAGRDRYRYQIVATASTTQGRVFVVRFFVHVIAWVV